MSAHGERCPTCKGWIFFAKHTCPPSFEVRNLDDKDDESAFNVVYARDEEEAAEKWADDYDSYGDYTIVGGSSVKVEVRHRNGESKFYEVSGESVPRYTASELDATL